MGCHLTQKECLDPSTDKLINNQNYAAEVFLDNVFF